MDWSQIQAVGVALGVGLLIGVERERGQRLQHPERKIATGVRSFAITAVLGSLCAMFGEPILAVGLGGVVLLSALGYRHTSLDAPGLTTEFTLVAVFLLGALAHREPGLVAGISVLLALLLESKQSIHRLSRELISAAEMRDGLLLAAAALIVLPLLPDQPIDPLGVLNPQRIWLLVVLVMAVSALGHVTLRLVGARRGLPLAGFFAGYVSSTAAVAGFGERVRNDPGELRPAVSAALLANLASLSLFVPLLLAISLPALLTLSVPLAAAAGVLLASSLYGLRGANVGDAAMPTAASRMFRFRHALLFAVLISLIVAGASLLNHWLGPRAAVLGAIIAALAELHAAGASLAQLFAAGGLSDDQLRWGYAGLLIASASAKSLIAFISGGRDYGLRVAFGLGLMAALGTGLVALGV